MTDVPGGNASRDEWAAYASKEAGAPLEDTRPVDEGGLSRDALREKYGTTEPQSGKVIRYTGRADERHITKAAWTSIGVTDQDDVSWTRENAFKVSTKDLSKSALEYFDRDGEFVLEDA